ncbi:sensor histidine kinase [Chitinispirillum alkaliphilum]|nr:sensor histidine kinase [Chitinispirillum alkaliphilum]
MSILDIKQQLETVFDSIGESICIIDSDFKILRVNKSYAQNANCSIKSVLSKSCWSVFWCRDTECSNCPAKTVFKTGNAVEKVHFTRKLEGEVKYFMVSVYPVKDSDNVVTNVIECIRDITEEKRIVEQLIRSEKLASIGIMTAGVAHEMNNPLSGISGMATNMIKMPSKYGLNEKGVSRVQMILESSSKATQIMKGLLHLSRKQDSVRVIVDINALVRRSIDDIHFPGISEIRKSFYPDQNAPPVKCDPNQIEQVIINIMTNAIQSILEKSTLYTVNDRFYEGYIKVSIRNQGSGLLVSFTDNGMGIPEEIQSKIFDPFFTTRPAGQGTGLGLSICNRIIEEHGGKLFFENLDGQSVFCFTLPLDDEIPERSIGGGQDKW